MMLGRKLAEGMVMEPAKDTAAEPQPVQARDADVPQDSAAEPATPVAAR